MKIRHVTLFILFLLAGTVLGFADTNVSLTVKFDQIYGLKNGDQVIFELNHIGDVENVNYGRDGIYSVTVKIRNNFANAVTEHSKFFIIDDPLKEGHKAIEVTLEQTGGIRLEDGAVVDGSSSRSAVLKKLEIDIEKGLAYLKKEFGKFQEQVDKVPESEEYQELKKKLTNLVEQLKLATKETNKKIQKELIPKIIRELDKIENMLRKYGEEKQDESPEDQPEDQPRDKIDEPKKI